VKNQVQLITYIDRIGGGGIRYLNSLLEGPLANLFGGAHLLPFFHPIDGADAGFDPIDHTQIDERLGTWKDLRALGDSVELMVDLIVNHVSAHSPQFQDFSAKGSSSKYAALFLTYDRVFPQGATEAELLRIYRPRPGLPFTYATLKNGQKRLLWTTFTSQQIDIDLDSEQGQEYIDSILQCFHAAGVRALRLDAVGYAVKRAGTSCFMIPETYALIRNLSDRASTLGMEVLVEIHSHYRQQIEIAKTVDWVYDFALPPLILHSLYTSDAQPLYDWLLVRPRNAITVLDTHDGIGVIDVGADSNGAPGLLTTSAIDELVKTIHKLSNGQSEQATGGAANNLDLYQVNCTYLDALGRDENLYLLARAIQFFTPGIPQVYYVGFLGGTNDMDLLAETRVGRDINRHYYTRAEVMSALQTPLVARLIELIKLRNFHPAFGGEFSAESKSRNQIDLEWQHLSDMIRLHVDFAQPLAFIEYSTSTTGMVRISIV
jgi:sucrose phosphorylase